MSVRDYSVRFNDGDRQYERSFSSVSEAETFAAKMNQTTVFKNILVSDSWRALLAISSKQGSSIYGFGSSQKEKILEQLKSVVSEKCAKAFKAAGLKTPEDVLSIGITIFQASLLKSPTDMSKFGLSSDSTDDKNFRNKMLDAWNRNSETDDVTTESPYNGRIYMALPNRAFNNFGETFVHAMMHAAGAEGRGTHPVTTVTESLTRTPGQRFPHAPVKRTVITREVPNTAGMHDLSWMNKESYDSIIENCAKK